MNGRLGYVNKCGTQAAWISSVHSGKGQDTTLKSVMTIMLHTISASKEEHTSLWDPRFHCGPYTL